jgi:hypothetical protein
MTLHARPATLEDVRYFYPDGGSSFRAWVCEMDGVVSGIIGVVLMRPYACIISSFNEVLRPFLKSLTIMRLIKKVQAVCEASRVPVVAIADPNEPTSEGILKRLGFVFFDVIDGDRVFKWDKG